MLGRKSVSTNERVRAKTTPKLSVNNPLYNADRGLGRDDGREGRRSGEMK